MRYFRIGSTTVLKYYRNTFERGFLKVDFSHVKKKPGELGLKLITKLINFSKKNKNKKTIN